MTQFLNLRAPEAPGTVRSRALESIQGADSLLALARCFEGAKTAFLDISREARAGRLSGRWFCGKWWQGEALRNQAKQAKPEQFVVFCCRHSSCMTPVFLQPTPRCPRVFLKLRVQVHRSCASILEDKQVRERLEERLAGFSAGSEWKAVPSNWSSKVTHFSLFRTCFKWLRFTRFSVSDVFQTVALQLSLTFLHEDPSLLLEELRPVTSRFLVLSNRGIVGSPDGQSVRLCCRASTVTSAALGRGG